jgi:hypothetical protein
MAPLLVGCAGKDTVEVKLKHANAAMKANIFLAVFNVVLLSCCEAYHLRVKGK